MTAAETQTKQTLKDRVCQIIDAHAAELEDLAKALEAPLAGLRREASATARSLSLSVSASARSA